MRSETYQTKAEQAQASWEMRHHWKQVTSDVNGIQFGGVSVGHAQLPLHILEPLLVHLQFGELRFLRVQVRRQGFLQLLLQGRDIWRRTVSPNPGEECDKGVIERAEQIDEEDEAA